MLSESELIKGCKEYNQAAQKALYWKYAPVLKAICIRYASDGEEAKDLLQESFIKIFSGIGSFSSKGSFEGWMKRIVVNTAINHYKKNKRYLFNTIESVPDQNLLEEEDLSLTSETEYTKEQLLSALKSVPEPYRIVFNMFYIEEISHKEIAANLEIDEKTSRTRLFRAKKILQNYLLELKEDKLLAGERRVK